MTLSGDRDESQPVPTQPGAPRTSRARAAVIVVIGLAVAGVLVGALWAWIAPAIHGVVALTRARERVHIALGNESEHFFIGAVLMLGLLSVLATISAVLLWQWRVHRGPVMVAALSIGLAAAAAAATGVGAALVRWHYGAIDVARAPVTVGHRVQYVAEAPPVFFGHSAPQIAATILLPAAVAALIYALTAVSTSRDDLGAWPAVEPDFHRPPAPVAAPD